MVQHLVLSHSVFQHLVLSHSVALNNWESLVLYSEVNHLTLSVETL